MNGAIVGPSEARVSVFDRGFLYGDGLFEVLRTYGGKPFLLDRHIARLLRGAQEVLIDEAGSASDWEEAVASVLAAAGPGEYYLRLMLTRGEGRAGLAGGLDPALAHHPHRLVFAEPWVPRSPDAPRHGIASVTVHDGRAVEGTSATAAKVTHYLRNLLALHEAKQREAAEAILVDGMGRVVEGATSSVFFVEKGTLLTPPLERGPLPGITRDVVLSLARHLGIPVEERDIPKAALPSYDEAFLTSSLREVLPIVRIDGNALANGIPGPLTRTLHRAYLERAGVAGPPWPWDGFDPELPRTA